MKISISLAQMHLQYGQIEHNFDQAVQMITEASKKKSTVIIFPELWTSGYDLQNTKFYSQLNVNLIKSLSDLAEHFHIWIGGSFIEESDGNFYNTFRIIPPDRSPQAIYQKIHLFHLMDEQKWLQAGKRLQILNSPWGRTGLAICYDLRFPEMFRCYALAGVQLILIAAEWPLKRIKHWKILIKARAIENQVFIAAINSVGQTGNIKFGGCSAIVDPWGETVVEGNAKDEQLLTAEINMDKVIQTRNAIRVFNDRRQDIYSQYIH